METHMAAILNSRHYALDLTSTTNTTIGLYSVDGAAPYPL